jgi:hypothetical protein
VTNIGPYFRRRDFGSGCTRCARAEVKDSVGSKSASNLMALSTLALVFVFSSAVKAGKTTMDRLDAIRQNEASQSDAAQQQIEVTRDSLADLANNLKTLSDFAKQLYDFRELKLPDDTSEQTREFFESLRPAQSELQGLEYTPNHFDLLSYIYDLTDAVRQDLELSSLARFMPDTDGEWTYRTRSSPPRREEPQS